MGTHREYDRDRLYPVWQPPNPEFSDAVFAAAQREEVLGYTFCRERGIGQQAIFNAFKKVDEQFLGGCSYD